MGENGSERETEKPRTPIELSRAQGIRRNYNWNVLFLKIEESSFIIF